MTFSREEIVEAMKEWNLAWKNHDLEGVMKLFHEDVFLKIGPVEKRWVRKP